MKNSCLPSTGSYLSFFLTHIWRTIRALIIIFVPEESNSFIQRPWLLRFLIQGIPQKQKQTTTTTKKQQQKTPKINWIELESIIKAQLVLTRCATMNDSRLVQLFGLWSSRSWSTVTLSKGGHSWSSTKISTVVFSCAMLPSPRRML